MRGRWLVRRVRVEFGLTVAEVLRISRAPGARMTTLKILTNLGQNSKHQIVRALDEAAAYAELGKGRRVQYLEVGGGLGVDYDWSQTT